MSDGHSNQPDTTNTSITHESAQPRRFREWFPRLFAAPSPTIPTIAEQCAARGEPVPLGETARAIRDRGYVVAAVVHDRAVLRTRGENALLDVSATGKATDYVYAMGARDYADQVIEVGDAITRATHAELDGAYEAIAFTLAREIVRGYIYTDVDRMTLALRMLREEASRRESALEARASLSLAN